jgi:hypothetical protein
MSDVIVTPIFFYVIEHTCLYVEAAVILAYKAETQNVAVKVRGNICTSASFGSLGRHPFSSIAFLYLHGMDANVI